MPNTKLTKATLQNHYQYSKMIYLLIILAAWMVGDLIYSANEYKSPPERRVDVMMVGMFAATDRLDNVAEVALEAGRAFERRRAVEEGIITEAEMADYDTPLEVVNFFPIQYDPNNTEDAFGVQKYFLTFATQEGDIFFLIRPLMEELVAEGLALPLDDFIARGILNPGDRDLSEVTFEEPVMEGEEPTGVSHVYALQATPLFRLLDDDGEIIYNNLGTYMVIVSYSANPDTAAAVMQSLMDQLETPAPEWFQAYLEQSAAENTDEAE